MLNAVAEQQTGTLNVLKISAFSLANYEDSDILHLIKKFKGYLKTHINH